MVTLSIDFLEMVFVLSKVFQAIGADRRAYPTVMTLVKLMVVLLFPSVTGNRIQYFLSFQTGVPGFSG